MQLGRQLQRATAAAERDVAILVVCERGLKRCLELCGRAAQLDQALRRLGGYHGQPMLGGEFL